MTTKEIEKIIDEWNDKELIENDIGCFNEFDQGLGRCKYNREARCTKGAFLTSTLIGAHPADCPLRNKKITITNNEKMCNKYSVIEWDDEGYPTDESLKRLEEAIENGPFPEREKYFYAALGENIYINLYPPKTKVEVRGEPTDVIQYHTNGWSGNEAIINTLSKSFLFDFLLERYDKGGHYYFQAPKGE